MSRIARLVVPGLPHHVTQRGNGRQQVFFEEGDYALYTDLILEAAQKAHCEIWALDSHLKCTIYIWWCNGRKLQSARL